MRNHNVGNAGEFYVLAQLAQRGFIAGKTDDGQTLIDVIATDPATLKAINIQVKATEDDRSRWIMSQKNEAHFESLWYVLVQLNGADQMPDFFIFHSNEIGPWLKNDHEKWLVIPKKNGEKRKDTKMRRFKPSPDQLAKAKDQWDRMFSS